MIRFQSRSKNIALGYSFLLALALASAASAQEAKWESLFDGKTLDGWEKVGKATSNWEVKDGALAGSGDASMLVCTKGPYKNFKYRAEVKINDKGNSGLYFRTTRKPGFSDGYEAQIDSTHSDPIRTGSLYGMCHVYKRVAEPDAWFTYELEVRDDVWRGREMTRIKITVNGDELYEFLDFDKTFKEGHFAFQQHDPGSKVLIRKIEVMPLPEAAKK
jgi:hypothetical protein